MHISDLWAQCDIFFINVIYELNGIFSSIELNYSKQIILIKISN